MADYYREKFRKKQATRQVIGYGNHIDGYIKWELGDINNAMQCFNKEVDICLDNISRNNLYSVWRGRYVLASIYSFLNKKDEAMELLIQLEKDGYLRCKQIMEMKNSPFFNNLREDNEFNKIIIRQEKKYAEIRAEIDRLEENGLL